MSTCFAGRATQLKSTLRAAILCVLVLGLTGCETIPPVANDPHGEAAGALHASLVHLAQVKTLAAQGQLTMKRGDGQSVTLDVALVLRTPDHMRFRAWKFDQAVFDITATSEGVWIWRGRDDSRWNSGGSGGQGTKSRLSEDLKPRLNGAVDIGKMLAVLAKTMTKRDWQRVMDAPSDRLVLRRHDENGGWVTIAIDRATRTLRNCLWTDAAGRQSYDLRLGDYRQDHEILWPARLTAASPEGVIDVALDDADINDSLSPAAFIPPPGAVKQP